MCWNSPLPSKRRVWAKGNSPTTEGIDATPTAWDVEQFELAKHGGNGRINEKVVASRLQTKHQDGVASEASEDHEAGHQHFVDDVNNAVISAHVGPCDGRSINLNAFQQG